MLRIPPSPSPPAPRVQVLPRIGTPISNVCCHESCCCRAYSIDRELLTEAQHVGFQIKERLEEWQQLPGSLKGMVYELTRSPALQN